MTEPHTPDTPSTSTPTSDEAAALALLDARGHRAATSLRTAVGTLLAEVPPPAGGPADDASAGEAAAWAAARGSVAGPDVAVVGLRPAAARRAEGRTWLIAAAVLVVAGLVAAVALLVRADDEQGMVTDDVPGYLVPGWLPDGWELQEARVLHPADVPGALTGTVTVYGDPGADDPWAGPQLSVWQTVDDGQGLDEGDGIEQITVGGLPATIEGQDGTTLVRILDGHRMVLVMADQIERPEVLAAAEAAAGGDVAGARPDGLERLASGPLGAAGMLSGFAVEGLSLVYGGASSATGEVVVVQQAGDRDDAQLVRLMSTDVVTTEVRGLPAYEVEGTLLQWYEPSAHAVVTVTGSGVDSSLLSQFAEGLGPSRPGEIDELVRAHGSSGPFSRLQPGEVLVTEGEYPDGQAWRLVASDDGSEGFGLSFADGAGSSGTGVSKDGGWGTLSVDTAGHQATGQSDSVGVYGAVTPQASEVVVEAAGHEPIRFGLHTVTGIAGWDRKVFAGVVPAGLGSAQVVARAADGTELARVPLDVGTGNESSGGSAVAPTIPGSGGGGDSSTSETCRTLPDGGEECTTSGSATAAPGG